MNFGREIEYNLLKNTIPYYGNLHRSHLIGLSFKSTIKNKNKIFGLPSEMPKNLNKFFH